MNESIKQNFYLVAAVLLAGVTVATASTIKGKNDGTENAIPASDVRVRVIADDGSVLMLQDCEAKREPDGTITIKANSKGSL